MPIHCTVHMYILRNFQHLENKYPLELALCHDHIGDWKGKINDHYTIQSHGYYGWLENNNEKRIHFDDFSLMETDNKWTNDNKYLRRIL